MSVGILAVDDEVDAAHLFRQHFRREGAAGAILVAFRLVPR
jgi:hypothetical protein